MDEVGKAPPSVDLDDRDPLPIFRFELWVAVDRDLLQLEAELTVRSRDHSPGRLAEVTARRGVEDDLDAQRISSSLTRTASNASSCG